MGPRLATWSPSPFRMGDLPVVSGMEARRAFEKRGWEFRRQTGSHMILAKQGVDANLSVPAHTTLDRGTLRRLIRDAGLSVEEFKRLL
jgi:predicted RNA binding protein YcfA (HicA-like mRNA interferase family)